MSTYQNRADAAKRAHIAEGIRKDYADEYDFEGISDEDIIRSHKANFAADVADDEYAKALEGAYGSDYKAPSMTLGERAGQLGEVGKELAAGAFPYVVAEAPLAVEAGAKLAGKAVLGAASAHPAVQIAKGAAFVGAHAVNMKVDQLFEDAMRGELASVPFPHVGQTVAKFYAALRPGLSAKGWKDEDIREEAKKRAFNIARGYTETTDSMQQDIDAVDYARKVAEPAGMAADAVFMGAGAPLIEGVVQKGLAKLGMEAAAKATVGAGAGLAGGAARTSAGTAAKNFTGGLIKSAATGGGIGALGMAAHGATEGALRARLEGKTPQEVTAALIENATKQGAQGFGFGAGLGALLHTGVSAVAAPFAAGAAKSARKAALEAANTASEHEMRSMEAAGNRLDEEAAVAKSEAVRNVEVVQSGRDFRPEKAQGQIALALRPAAPEMGQPARGPADIATTIIQMQYGDKMARSQAGLEAAAEMAKKIKLWDDANVALAEPHPAPLPQGPGGPPVANAAQVGENQLHDVVNNAGQPIRAQVEPGERLLESAVPPVGAPGVRRLPEGAVTPLPAPKAEVPAPEAVPSAPVRVPETAKGTTPNEHVRSVKSGYNKSAGLTAPVQGEYHPVEPATARKIAEEYAALPKVPATPETEAATRKSYDALNREIAEQKAAIEAAGYKIEFTDSDPYKNSQEMLADLRDNKTLKVFTAKGEYHPFMTNEQTNDFRAVHDFFGHGPEGFQFGARGEDNAWRSHAQMFSNEAIPALTTETRGQNSWVNFGPGQEGKSATEKGFAEQKAGLLPEWTYDEVLHKNVGTPAPVPTSARTAQAVAGLKLSKGVTETPEGLHIESGLTHEPGKFNDALNEIVRSGDERGLPVTAKLNPIKMPNGGTMSAEKQMRTWGQKGFRIVEQLFDEAGNPTSAIIRREPIGAHQNAVASRLESIAEGARKRIAARSGKMSSGFDVAAVGDVALELAADMFSKKLRSGDEIASWLVQKYGETVKPFIEKITAAAQKHFTRMFKDTGTAEKNLSTLLELGQSGRHGGDWYEGTAKWAKQNFGEDADMMLRFLAVTSANGQTESGAAMALKAFAQWKSGMPFEGFRGDSMRGQLEKAVRGEDFGEFTKINNFYQALKGNKDAIVLDRWMIDALNLHEKGGALRENDYRIYEHVVRQLAEQNDMTARQFQAAVWEGARIRKAHVTEAKGGRAATTKSGSAYPLEVLVNRKLGGMSIEQYIDASGRNLKEMEQVYRGLAPVRKGQSSGHTFDLKTMEPDKRGGYVVSMASTLVPKKKLYPAEVFKFKKQIETISEQFPERHLTLGVFASDAHPGMFSIDLNMTLPDREAATRFGKLNRQESFAHLAPGGDFIENIPTGYKEAKHGPQFNAPEKGSRETWAKQHANRLKGFMKQAGL